MSSVSEFICLLSLLYIIAMVGRFILSWFPVAHDSPVAMVSTVLFTITEPLLAPVRKLVPPIRIGAGLMDVSAIIVLIVLQVIVRGIILGCG